MLLIKLSYRPNIIILCNLIISLLGQKQKSRENTQNYTEGIHREYEINVTDSFDRGRHKKENPAGERMSCCEVLSILGGSTKFGELWSTNGEK